MVESAHFLPDADSEDTPLTRAIYKTSTSRYLKWDKRWRGVRPIREQAVRDWLAIERRLTGRRTLETWRKCKANLRAVAK